MLGPLGNSFATLAPHLRKRLESALDSGLLPSSCSLASLQSVLGLASGGEELLAELDALQRLGISGRAAAAWLRTAGGSWARASVPDLVWSGPPVPGLHARDTRRVYEELVGTAERSIWISTYVYFDGPRTFASLAQRMDAAPALRVTLLLNLQRSRGDTAAADYLVRRFADDFWRTDWPGSSRPAIYYDPRSLETDRPASVLHAKAVVSDEEAVFITSANLTEAGFDRNIELGVLIRDRTLAIGVKSHFQVLIEEGLLKPLPA